MVLNALTPTRQVIKERNKGICHRYAINFVWQRRNKRTGCGRLIYMRINFMLLGGMFMYIYICSHEEWLYLFRFKVKQNACITLHFNKVDFYRCFWDDTM